MDPAPRTVPTWCQLSSSTFGDLSREESRFTVRIRGALSDAARITSSVRLDTQIHPQNKWRVFILTDVLTRGKHAEISGDHGATVQTHEHMVRIPRPARFHLLRTNVSSFENLFTRLDPSQDRVSPARLSSWIRVCSDLVFPKTFFVLSNEPTNAL